jgi:hypothetical protein
MKKLDIVFIILGIFLGILCYFSTKNLIFSILILVIFVVDYFILMRKKFVQYFSLIERVHTSYHFINSFIISLSVKDSLEDAYQNGIRINNTRLNAETKELNEMPVLERVKYLYGYFNLSIYKVFLNVLDLYQDQGGNILNMSDNLLRECTRTEKTLSDTLSIGYKHLTEFLILWLLSFSILLFMRFSIEEFYMMMLKSPFVAPLIFIFFVICIVSINLFVNSFTNLTIKEGPKQ